MTTPNTEPVDMVAIARENALADALLSRPGMIKVIAPAKVNLLLSIGAKRDDGLHNVDNVLHAVMLHDVLFMRSLPGEAGSGLAIVVACIGRDGVEPPVIEPEENIAYRAVEQLAAALGRSEDERIEIVIEKHIPHQAGLGGGSSDAAAALAGLAQLWGLSVDDPAVVDVACALGSDVSFFLHGGCALFDGAGECYQRTLEPRRESIVIVRPDSGLSTKEVYAEFDRDAAAVDAAVVEVARTATSAADIPLANNLAPAAERLMPELSRIRAWLEADEGVRASLLCGSGSSSFAICDDFATASAVAARAQAQGWWARATSFSSARAMPIPS